MREIPREEMRVMLLYPNLSMMKIPALVIGLFTDVLNRQGYHVEMFDGSFYRDDRGDKHTDRRTSALQYRKMDTSAWDLAMRDNLEGEFLAHVDRFQPHLILISVVEDTFMQGVRLMDLIKDRNIPNLWGGVYPTMAPAETLSYDCVGAVGVGEGEELIVRVAERIRQGRPFSDLKGVWVRDDSGKPVHGGHAPLVDISAVHADYSLFQEKQFYRPWGGKMYKTITLEGMRGCPYMCTFCNSPRHNELAREEGYGSFVRKKDIEALRAELRRMVESVNPGFIMFVDDTFLTRSMKELEAWGRMYEEFRIPFWCNTRVESITAEKLALLKSLGCRRLSFSLEHGDEEYRKTRLLKKFTNEQFISGGSIVSESGIPFSMDVLIGLPFETRDMTFKSVDVIRRVEGFDALTVSIFTPYRGTKLRADALNAGFLDPNARPGGISGESLLKMPRPYLQPMEIEGLFRTFVLYTFFPKDRWEEIRRAESFDEEGDRVFDALAAEYYDKKFNIDAETLAAQRYARGSGCRAPDLDSV